MGLKKVYSKVRKSVVHQDEAIKKMILTVDHNLKYGLYSKQNVLLMGSIGTGKTLLCKKCAEAMKLPFYQISGVFAEGRFQRFQMNEAIIKLAEKADEDDEQIKGIILIENADNLFLNETDNGFLTMAKNPEFYVASGEVGIFDFVDISKVTFVAEGQYNGKPNNKINVKSQIGFTGFPYGSIGQRIQNGDEDNITSRFTRTIEMNSLSDEFVRDFLENSDISVLNEICDGLETTPFEIDRIVNEIMERGVGLHSAPAVISEVMYPKLEKKHFSSKKQK